MLFIHQGSPLTPTLSQVGQTRLPLRSRFVIYSLSKPVFLKVGNFKMYELQLEVEMHTLKLPGLKNTDLDSKALASPADARCG